MRLHHYPFLALALAPLIAGCTRPVATPAPPAGVATLTPNGGVLDPSPETTETADVVSVRFLNEQVPLGSMAEWGAEFSPTRLTFTRDAEGIVVSTSYNPEESAQVDVAEMRVCIALDNPCQPPDEWSPFEPRLVVSEQVTWNEVRQFWIVGEFRDSQGNPVQVLNTYRAPEPMDELEDYGTITGFVDASTPVTMQPPLAQTALAVTASAFPLQGSVLLQNGLCCAGGPADTLIDVSVTFEATSPAGPVTEMLVTGCGSAGDSWEPFVPQKTCQTRTTGNWTTFSVSVQYRDNQGNLSPVYMDDIAVEGMPVTPTP